MNVQIRFSGIFLLSRPKSAKPNRGSRAEILLPNTIGVPLPGNGANAHSHVHHGFLVRHNGTQACSLPKEPETLLHLYHADVVFRFDRRSEPGTPDPAGQLDFSHYVNQPLLPLGMLKPSVRLRPDLDPHDRSPDARLGGRVTTSRGSFTTCPAAEPGFRFVMRGGFTPDEPEVTPGQHLNCNVLGVEALLIDFRYNEDDEWRTKDLTTDDGSNVQLTVGFLCDEDPVDWDRRNAGSVQNDPEAELPDEDFGYLYNLLQPRTRAVWPPAGGFSIPVAVPLKQKSRNASTIRGATTSTCFPGDCPGC